MQQILSKALFDFSSNLNASQMRLVSCAFLTLFATACVQMDSRVKNQGEFAVVTGPGVADNKTPIDRTTACVRDLIKERKQRQIAFTVGNIKDYTGKFSESDGGTIITQGGSLMVISALGKLGDIIAVRERFDTQIAMAEFSFLDKRRLSDGRTHAIVSKGKKQRVSWMPDPGGAVLRSEVYIVGGITELNYNISSGGVKAEIHGIGPRVRTFAINVAVDLRLVNTRNLNVLKTVSLQKQVVGYEISANIFSFFGSNLFDIELGMKAQEPLQLAIRSVLEMATMELVSHVYLVDYKSCYFDNFAEEVQKVELNNEGNIAAANNSRQTARASEEPADYRVN